MGRKGENKKKQGQKREYKTYTIEKSVAEKLDKLVFSLKEASGVPVSVSDVLNAFFSLLNEFQFSELSDKFIAYAVLSKVVRNAHANVEDDVELSKEQMKALTSFERLVKAYSYCDALVNADESNLKKLLSDYVEFLKKNKKYFYGDFERSVVHYTLNALKGKVVFARKPRTVDSLIKALEKAIKELGAVEKMEKDLLSFTDSFDKKELAEMLRRAVKEADWTDEQKKRILEMAENLEKQADEEKQKQKKSE